MKWKCGFWLSGLNWHDKKFKFVICINWSSFFLDFYPYFCIYASIEKGKKESSKYSACSNYPLALTSQSHHKTQKLNSFHITFFFFFYKVFSSSLNNTKFSSWLVGALLYIRRRGSKKLEAHHNGKRESDKSDIEELA